MTTCALSGDGMSLSVVEGKKTVTIRSVETGATLQEFTHEKAVTSSALSEDGRSHLTTKCLFSISY